MNNYLLHGPLASIKNLIYVDGTTTTIAGIDVIGPVTLDGVTYVNIDSNNELTIPSDCTVTGPELSNAILGEWATTTQYKNVTGVLPSEVDKAPTVTTTNKTTPPTTINNSNTTSSTLSATTTTPVTSVTSGATTTTQATTIDK